MTVQTCLCSSPPVLDYLRALASPLAAFGAVWLAAFLGVRGFRKQKMIERRLNWYEQVHGLLGRVALAYAYIDLNESHAPVAIRDQARQQLVALTQELAGVADAAHLYAEQSDYDILMAFVNRMSSVDHGRLQDANARPAIVTHVVKECQTTAHLLSRSQRVEMGLPLLKPHA